MRALCRVFESHDIDGTVVTDSPPTISSYAVNLDKSRIGTIEKAFLDSAATSVTFEEVAEENWAESWKQFFKVKRIGKHFLVCPTWEEAELEPGDHLLLLDPGQSFGTGDHPTTCMCLQLLETENISGKTVADVGCGSGILSVAAGRLGAASITSTDVDEICVVSTRENADRNNIELTTWQGKGFEGYAPGQQFDLVLSNIISSALIMLASEAAQRVKPGGSWIVSGILEMNWPDVFEAANKQGFQLVTKIQEGEWVAAKLSR